MKPSVLHGDLWSGNIGSVNGKPCIFDPAVYYGHHEVRPTARKREVSTLTLSLLSGGVGHELVCIFPSCLLGGIPFSDPEGECDG